MALSVKQMMEAANAVVPKITPAQANDMIGKGNTLVVDVRDAPEVEKSGKVAGAVHVSRGMLEFRADSESPYHDKNFAKDKTVILYCTSGGRAALAGKLLKDMGYGQVYNIGGFKDWAESGGAIERPIEPGIIWFKDCAYGQKCGVLVWCQKSGFRYRAGIQFISLNQVEEECLRWQIEGSQQCTPLLDPQRVVATLIDSIRKDREGKPLINSQP